MLTKPQTKAIIEEDQDGKLMELFKNKTKVTVKQLINFHRQEQRNNIEAVLNTCFADAMQSIQYEMTKNPFQGWYAGTLASLNVLDNNKSLKNSMYYLIQTHRDELVGTSDDKKLLKDIKDSIDSEYITKIEIKAETLRYELVIHFE